jgi:hypothetical protein
MALPPPVNITSCAVTHCAPLLTNNATASPISSTVATRYLYGHKQTISYHCGFVSIVGVVVDQVVTLSND